MEGILTIHFSCIRRMSVEALSTALKEACFNQPLDTEMSLAMLAEPDTINKKAAEVVEKFLASAPEADIKAQLIIIPDETLAQLDARILWAVRKPLKETHPEFHQKGSWWWWFVLKYVTNNAAFVFVFGLCTVIPTVLAFEACKAMYNVKTPAYMDPPVVAKEEGEEEEEPEEYRPPRYLLNGPAIRIPWFPPDEAFTTFATVWDRISIGGKRDPSDPTRGIEGIARYGADAIARGSPMDPGKRIPLSALGSKRAFTNWAKQNGYEDGLSIIVDGLLPEGGKPIGPMDPRYATSSRERQKATQQSEQKNVRNVAYWTPKLDEDNE